MSDRKQGAQHSDVVYPFEIVDLIDQPLGLFGAEDRSHQVARFRAHGFGIERILPGAWREPGEMVDLPSTRVTSTIAPRGAAGSISFSSPVKLTFAR